MDERLKITISVTVSETERDWKNPTDGNAEMSFEIPRESHIHMAPDSELIGHLVLAAREQFNHKSDQKSRTEGR